MISSTINGTRINNPIKNRKTVMNDIPPMILRTPVAVANAPNSFFSFNSPIPNGILINLIHFGIKKLLHIKVQ